MSKNSSAFEARLAAYGSMSLALAAVAMPGVARAQEAVYSGQGNNTSAGPVFFDPASGWVGTSPSPLASSLNFELVTSNQGKSSLGKSIFRDLLFLSPGNETPGNGNQLAISSSLAAKLSPGALIGSGLGLKFGSFGTLAGNSSFDAAAQWNTLPATGDLGLLQTQGCTAGSGTCYGWANITVDLDTYVITLNSFGYDNSGAAVTAGSADSATPEPASILLLALGAAGIGAWRRKKAAAR